MHIRRYGPVQHSRQIALDGSKRRAEIMGNIGYELLLIFFGSCYLTCHIFKRTRQISHFIPAVALIGAVGHIALCVFLCRYGDILQRCIYKDGKTKKDLK